MTPADDFSTYYDDLLDGRYDCVDRLILNAYFTFGHNPGGFRQWWRALTGSDATLDNTHLMRMAARFARRVYAYAGANGIPVIHCDTKEHKHEIAEVAQPCDPTVSGLFLILVARAKAPLWEITRKDDVILNIKRKMSYVNHYYFHIQDPEWGHLCIKICGHPPFPATIILNGHEWVEREAGRHGLAFTKEGNCFTDANNWNNLDQYADTLSTTSAIGQLAEVIDRWLYSACLNFALDQVEQEQTGFRYAFSCYQLEYSRNLLFQRGTDVDRVFQALIDRTRTTLDIKKVMHLFGAKHRPSRRRRSKRGRAGGSVPRLQYTIERPTHDLTVFKVHFGLLTLKIYAKGERVLRVEAVAHNVKALKQGKVLSQLPALVTTLQGMAIRFLDVLRAAHPATFDAAVATALARPSQVGAQRLAGIDIRALRTRAVLHALFALGISPTGFAVRDLAQTVRSQMGWDADQYTIRHAAYDFKKLRGKGLITQIARKRRYQLDLSNAPVAYATLVLHEQVFCPILSGVAHHDAMAKREPQHEIDRHYETVWDALHATMQAVSIAA